MPRAGKWARIFLDGVAMTTYTTDVTVSTTYDEVESSAYTQDKRYILGQGDHAITLDGYFADVSLAALQAAGGKLMTVALGNNATPAAGDPSFSLSVAQSEVVATPAKDGVQAITGKFVAQNTGGWGILLADLSARATDGTGTAVDNGASSANGGIGYLHLGTLGSGSIQATVQHSADNSAWADLCVFTIDGTPDGAERIEVTGTVDRYVRGEWDITGTGTSFNIGIFFRRL